MKTPEMSVSIERKSGAMTRMCVWNSLQNINTPHICQILPGKKEYRKKVRELAGQWWKLHTNSGELWKTSDLGPSKKYKTFTDVKGCIHLKWGVLQNHYGVLPKKKTDTPQKCWKLHHFVVMSPQTLQNKKG